MNKIENEECVITGSISEKREEKPETDTTKRKISGIYKIVNKVNGKYYVGSSKDILKNRWPHHKRSLIGNYHDNSHLQNAWNKYGKENFDFIILEFVDKEKLLECEQKYLDIAIKEKNKTYNLSFIANRTEMNNENRNKLSKFFKNKYKNKELHPWFGKTHSKETLLKQSLCKMGNKNPNFGRIFSNEIRKKLSISHSKERHWNFGKHWSADVKSKISKNRGDMKGNKNPRFDNSIYIFENLNTQEQFQGNRFDFYQKYNLNKGGVCNLIKNKIKNVKGWTIKEKLLNI